MGTCCSPDFTRDSCALQAVAVSLEPTEQGGRVQLNLQALQAGDAEQRASLPAVRTAAISLTQRQSVQPALPISSQIQPAPPDQQQVMPTHWSPVYAGV